MNAADLLVEEINAKQTPLMVGLDTDSRKLPKFLQDKLKSDEAQLEFNMTIIDAVAPLVGVIKINNAFYEVLGWKGYRNLQHTISYAHSKGLIVVSDGKKGDIGNTADAYAEAQFRTLGADFATVNYYMGRDTLEPWEKYFNEGKGIFALARTSNPGSGDLQDRKLVLEADENAFFLENRLEHVPTVADVVAYKLNKIASQYTGDSGYSPVGPVVGANFWQEVSAIRNIMPNSIFLLPAYGAQGAAAEKLAYGFNNDGIGVVNNSRNAIFAFDVFVKEEFEKMKTADPDKFKELMKTNKADMMMFKPEQYIEAAIHSVKHSIAEINSVLYAANKLPVGWTVPAKN